MMHRIVAVVIVALVGYCWLAARRLAAGSPVARIALVWLGLICVQVALGAWTIWSNKAADVATAHVVVGALALVVGALLSIIVFREPVMSREAQVEHARIQGETPSAAPAASLS